MTTDPRIDLVARTLDEVAVAAVEAGAPPSSTLREAAAELLDKLDALARVESEDDAVRVVDRVLDECGIPYGDGHLALVPETATRIVRALLDTPIAHLDHATRQVTVQWPSDDVRVALVAREVLDAMVDETNRLRAGADFTPIPEEVEETPAQTYAYLLLASPERRIEILADLLTSSRRAFRCWVEAHAEQIDNLRRDLDNARAELTHARSDPDGVLTVPAGTTDDVLDQVRAVVPDGVDVQRAAPQWPAPDIAVDLIDHTDEPVQP